MYTFGHMVYFRDTVFADSEIAEVGDTQSSL